MATQTLPQTPKLAFSRIVPGLLPSLLLARCISQVVGVQGPLYDSSKSNTSTVGEDRRLILLWAHLGVMGSIGQTK